MSDIYNTFPYYGYGTEDGSAYYKKPQPMDGEAVENAIDEKISDLVGNAPTDLDTIEELAAAVQSGSGDASDIYAKIDEVESKIPTTVEQLSDSANYAKVSDIPTSLEGLDNSETKYQSEDEVSATVQEAVENLFASVEYDDNAKKIIFKNSDGEQVGEVDATDFIKDGMVNGATIENGKLIITFNEESGSENVELDLTDIFNPSNYYTATECDNKYQPKGDYTTLAEVEAEGYTKFDGDYESLTNKPVIPTVPENVSEFNNDANYTTLEEVAAEGYSKFDGNYESLENKPVIPTVPENVSEFTNDAGYTTLEEVINVADGKYQPKGNYALISDIPNLDTYATEDFVTTEIGKLDIPSIEGLFNSVEYISAEKKIVFKDKTDAVVGSVDATDFVKDGMVDTVTVDENNNLVITFNTDSGKESVSVSLGAIFDPNNYFTTTQSDARYYQQDAANAIFVAKTTLESYSTTEQMDDAIDAAVEPKANKNDIDATINALVVRLNKLEATNNYLIEHNTDSADTINNMSPEDAANAEITVSTNEAIAALATPKTFKSVNVVGGELGSNTTITLNATEDVNVSGLTVSGTKGTGNGKINYATNEISIDSVNIEPGCSVYNVFEGSQDKTPEHSIDKFTAKNVVVNDVDLAHNVFNIYQFNDNAEVVISDSSFNMNVANSNVLRVSNVTNAKNVTITFKNIDLTYENKPYTDADVKWAGLVIYQAYGNDLAFAGDTSKISTWTFNFINCRYNGELVTQNEVGTIRQLIYQYQVNKQDCEAPTAFGDNINISVE